ncbi:hypothetical protein L9G74_21275, partial [Shewanella sp. C32]
YLQSRDLDSWQLNSARGYYLTQWAKTVCLTYCDSEEKDGVNRDSATEELLSLLKKMLSDSRWLETNRYVIINVVSEQY